MSKHTQLSDEEIFKAIKEACEKNSFPPLIASRDKRRKVWSKYNGLSICMYRIRTVSLGLINCMINKESIDVMMERYFQGKDTSEFYRFIEKYICPKKKINELLVDEKMNKKEIDVLSYLTKNTERRTAMQISKELDMSYEEVKSSIVKLRALGFKVVSRPGRYKSGYLLNDFANIIFSENWINNVRYYRYGLPKTFKYA